MFLQLNVPNVFLAEPVKILPRTIRNRSIMIDDEKGYKKVMDEKNTIYCKKNSDDLKNASRDNTKHF
jgi:hypothetical protein